MSKAKETLRKNDVEFIRIWCENAESGNGMKHVATLLSASLGVAITDKDCNAFASDLRQGKVYEDSDKNGIKVGLPRMSNSNKGRKAGQRKEVESMQTALGAMLSKYGVTLESVTSDNAE